MKLVFFLSAIIFGLCSQIRAQNSIDSQPLKTHGDSITIYKNWQLGWKIDVPNGWPILQKETTDEFYKKIIDSSKSPIDTSNSKILLFAQKNKHNLFIATLQYFDEGRRGNWSDNNSVMDQQSYQEYVDHIKGTGMKCDSMSLKEKIGGIEFRVFSIKIYYPGGKLVLDQLAYEKLVHGSIFGVLISTDNLLDKDTMITAWKNSIFDKDKWPEK